MKIEIKDNNAYVYTPYHPGFVREIKTIGRDRWDPLEKCWTVPAATVDRVREIMMDVYGETDLPDDTKRVTVRIRFLEEAQENVAPLFFLVKPLRVLLVGTAEADPVMMSCF